MLNVSDDYHWMSRALQLAERGRYTAKPNPCVGCVLVKNGVLVAEGWHHRAGFAHAEVNAIANAGDQASGATAYVSLEPCHHQGRTGPCTQALINAGIGRVVIGLLDPNPLVSGSGVRALLAAGLEVEGPLDGLCLQAHNTNIGFISRMERKKPWVRCKLAISLDGKTAMADGDSQWITGPDARSDVQSWRARSCAIVTGIESVIHDDSRLTLRKEELNLPKQVNVNDVISLSPLRVIMDTQCRLPLTASILEGSAPVLLLVSEAALLNEPRKIEAIKSKGNHISVETLALNENGQLNLHHLLGLLTAKECNELLIETGANLAGSFLQENLIDELIIYQAPVILGSNARSMITLPLNEMAEKKQLHIIDQRQIGFDQRIIARFS